MIGGEKARNRARNIGMSNERGKDKNVEGGAGPEGGGGEKRFAWKKSYTIRNSSGGNRGEILDGGRGGNFLEMGERIRLT